jgi:CubicO group peptidase (beta-lactamase class C family)
VADLEGYVPDRMRKAGVPGLSIALVRDKQVVCAAGFGVASRITGRAITPETVFEAASISKVVTTYTALRLVDQGRLALDQPLSVYLSAPWLAPSGYADQVTLRRLASHSSGLTDSVFPTVDRSIAFAPGSRFLYTGTGFMYMQEAIEQVTGKSLDAAAREAVFEPLGMASSSFVNTAECLPRMANGHMRPTLPLLAFLIPCVLVHVAIATVGIPIARLATGRWRPARRLMAGASFLAVVLTLLFYVGSSLNQLPNFLLLIGLCAAAFLVVFALALLLGRRVFACLPARLQEGKLGPLLGVAWVVSSFAALVYTSGLFTVPVPRRPSPPPSAVGSLRTTAGDLAVFLIELMEPHHLSRAMATEMATPQIPAGEGFSWGLGIGIQHSAQGDALWQNAQTFGFRGLMVVYPQHGWGVVVLTNSDHGYPLACEVAGRALGGEARWEFF